jgi:hemerythrin superfamily protein
MARPANALEMLRTDHRNVQALIQRFQRTADQREQRELCDQIVDELSVHTALEEGVFYPFIRESTEEVQLLEEANVEHTTAKDLLEQIQEQEPGSPRLQALVKVLGEYVALHIKEEEEQLFPLVQEIGVDLDALGEELSEQKETLRNGEARRSQSKTGKGQASRELTSSAHNSKAQSSQTHDSSGEDEAYLKQHGEELSRSIQRARWIHSTKEHEERPGQTLATRNHEVIRQWAEHRRARPCTTSGADPERPRVLRFN